MTTQEQKTSIAPTANTRLNRLPAPTLFVGPPSRNASAISLSRQAAESGLKPSRAPLERQKSALSRPGEDTSLKPPTSLPAIQLRRPSEKSIETKWREMQTTLNEVELTAQSSMHVFGEKHAAALDKLRKAQIELARAWGRGSEEQVSKAQNMAEAQDQEVSNATTRKRGDTETSASTQLSGESESSDPALKGRSNLENDTAEDIRLANERRAANEAYFKNVDRNVKEVVTRLEAVAEAMRGVEGESKSLWSNSSLSEKDITGDASHV